MKSASIILAINLAAASPALAQETIRIRLGVGPQIKPAYVGADKEKVAPLFRFDIARGGSVFRFKAPDDAPGIGVLMTQGFSFGPEVNLESGRRNSDVGEPLDDVKRTVEAGAFAQYDDGHGIRVRGDVRKGIGGHNGIVGSFGADKYWRDGDRYVFSIGPRILFSDDRYQQAFFGVTPQASLATGLPIYKPKGGIHGLSLTSGMTYQMGPHFGLFGYGSYERLVGDAAKSPIIQQLGSRDQYSGGIGVSYTFSVRP